MASDRPQHKRKRVKYNNEDSEEEEYLEGISKKEEHMRNIRDGWKKNLIPRIATTILMSRRTMQKKKIQR